jgi:hypothetical protein
VSEDLDPEPGVAVDPTTEALLARLLSIDAGDAARIRDLTPGRIRPRPQAGPTADYGDDR